MDADVCETITGSIDEMVADIAPDAGSRGMYGGTMFELELGDPHTAICGHFVYKNHISLEFSHGARLVDTAGVLEGGGKSRRHLKLRDLSDLDEKKVRGFLVAAFELGVPE